jgi:hypothetical protein
MTTKLDRSNSTCLILWILLIFQGASALFGGIALIFDPSGDAVQMPLALLERSFFSSYLVPGLILFFVLGLFPLLILYPLIAQPEWKWAAIFNIYPDMYWAWTYSLYTAIMLIIWITFQSMIVGYHILQTVYALLGIAILIMTLTPTVKNHYEIKGV